MEWTSTADARAAINTVEQTAEQLANALDTEMALADQRALVKMAAIKRIMERDGIAATPAEKIVESDDEFMAHRAKERESVVLRQKAEGTYAAAKFNAHAAVTMLDHRAAYGEGALVASTHMREVFEPIVKGQAARIAELEAKLAPPATDPRD